MMKFFRNIIIVFLFLFATKQAMSQMSTEEFATVEDSIIYNKFLTYGATFHNLGLGVRFRWGKRLNVYSNRFFEVEVQSLRSWKRLKLVNPYVINPKGYIYGKVNSAFVMHFGIFKDKRLNRKPNFEKGVELRWLYGGGFSLGVAKPYYLYVIYFYGMYEYRIESEKFDPDPSWDDIYGRAPFTKGFDELSFYPGLYFKMGLNFEYGRKKTKINSLEVGGALDILPTGLTIMYGQDNRIFFPTMYITLSFGKRYNKY
jgi:hypothetical protein